MKRIGLLGGSFDPVHRAHIQLANHALDALGLDEVNLIPAANPWQRAPLGASPEHRLAMLELAIQGSPGLTINTIELERSGPTYTLETLAQLPSEPEYFWILGSDQLQNFCTWKGWQDILNYVNLAVAQRPGAQVAPPAALQAHLAEQQQQLYRLSLPPIDISATEIRTRLKQHQNTDGLLDPAVQQYIKKHKLYLT